MLESQVLDEALQKKTREYETLKNQFIDMKKNYESKIKNLMNSISLLKSEKDSIESAAKDNIRVNIINKLKEERRDQELIITLLRKLVGDEDKVDKFLIKEFSKKGNQRVATYEELKIKIKQMESDIANLKFKNLTAIKKGAGALNLNSEDSQAFANENGKSYTNAENLDLNKNFSSAVGGQNRASKKAKEFNLGKLREESDEIIELRMAERFKLEINKYEERIKNLEEENFLLKIAKEKMEKSQNELFDKLQNYNQEVGELKSIYDVIKQNLEDDCKAKVNEALKRINDKEAENIKLKEKINEMIEICERQNKENFESIKRLNSENEVLRRLLEAKKYELSVLLPEIKNYQQQLEKTSLASASFNADSKDYIKIRTIEKEKEELKKLHLVNEEKIKHLDNIIKQKEFLLESLHNSIDDKEKILREKEEEIDLLNGKMQEMEIVLMKNYVKNNYNNY